MTLGEILFLLTLGAAGGYCIHAYGLDKKVMDSISGGLEDWSRRSIGIMLEEIDVKFPAVSLDEIAST
jgi:hypothetical protein